MTTTLDVALSYARAGYPVLPLHGIKEPAPPRIVRAFRAGELDKKTAQAYATCTCGRADCKSPGKHPKTPRGVNDATTSEAAIRMWFRDARVPTNVGIRIPEDQLALDVDVYVPGVKARLELMHLRGLPDTLTQASGAGGMHLLYSAPPGADYGSTLGGAPGVDLIHHRQRYLVAAPSLHWTGARYHWLDESEPTPAPAWVLEQAKRGARGFAVKTPTVSRTYGGSAGRTGGTQGGLGGADPRFGGPQNLKNLALEREDLRQPFDVEPFEWAVTLAAEKLEPAVSNDEEGSLEPGHVTLARGGCHLIAGLGLPPDEAVEVLWEEYNPRCVPPWGDDEREDFERTVLSAGAGAEEGYLLAKPWEAKLDADSLRRAEKRRKEGGRFGAADAHRPHKPEEAGSTPAGATKDSEWLKHVQLADRTKLPEPLKYLIDGLPLAPGGKVNTIIGAPNAAKSPFGMLLALCVASGKPFLGKPVLRPGPVVYVDNETGVLAELRDVRLCHGLGVERNAVPFEFAHMQSVFSEAFCEAFCQRLEQQPKPVLAVVDTYAGGLAPDVDHNSPEFAHWLRQIAKVGKITGCTMLVLMHEKKTQDTKRQSSLAMALGSYHAGGVMQSAITLFKEKPDDDPTLVTVLCGRAPEHSFTPFKVRWRDVDEEGAKAGRFKKDDRRLVSWGLVAEVEEGSAASANPKAAQADRLEAECARSILAYLARRPTGGTTLRDVLTYTRGLSKDRKRELLLKLVEEGLVSAWTAGTHDKYELAKPTALNLDARLAREVSDLYAKRA